jgi:cold shock CspA family protein
MPTGKIKWFNHQIGTGFIRSDEVENILSRTGVLLDKEVQAIRKGQEVSVNISKDTRTLSQTAASVTTAI